jgi:hypothetical protein
MQNAGCWIIKRLFLVVDGKVVRMDDSDNDSDDWAKEDLPEIPLPVRPKNPHKERNINNEKVDNDNDDDGWEQKIVQPTNEKLLNTQKDGIDDKNDTAGEPMIIVNMTTLSQRLSWPEIHCQFDPNSVNDIIAVKTLRQQVEYDYDTYRTNMEYITERIIIPCGSSVYRPALITLRKEYPGQYFYPIFPPKK